MSHCRDHTKQKQMAPRTLTKQTKTCYHCFCMALFSQIRTDINGMHCAKKEQPKGSCENGWEKPSWSPLLHKSNKQKHSGNTHQLKTRYCRFFMASLSKIRMDIDDICNVRKEKVKGSSENVWEELLRSATQWQHCDFVKIEKQRHKTHLTPQCFFTLYSNSWKISSEIVTLRSNFWIQTRNAGLPFATDLLNVDQIT